MRTVLTWRPARSLATEFSTRANSIGFLRLVLAVSVLVAHAAPLGYGRPNYGFEFTRGQLDFGGLGVNGFFVLSGFLITASGMRFSLPRYAWHRFLRIFPGFWVCLVVAACLLMPLVALYERDTLAGYWNHPNGPLDYIVRNATTTMNQYTISGLWATNPSGGAVNGSLWTLKYELTCYVLVGVLAWTGTLRRAPRMVLLVTVGLYLVVVADWVRQLPVLNTGMYSRGELGPFPVIGSYGITTLMFLVFMFLIGASMHLYRDRIPMHPAVAAVAAVAFVGSAAFGGFLVIGQPAYAYLLVWLSCKLPGWLQGIGRKRDYSYGIYIYAFPVQQGIAMLGWAEWGVAAYILLSLAGTVLLAVPSWHLVEKPAMSMKNWTPPFLARREEPVEAEPPAPPTRREAEEPDPVPVPARD
ncbi:acyltransferase [Virgisporangium ochraceum]|uniref:O-antigen acetylase n=1 Tax=Virgisporangium ochraceum TaxID=65505 RepID=A0A8J3ZRX5_9ACTN|nr:acyltransferase [Virgisporangium ochraceum]GIJ69077.1 O-antigen acetylase [Virgisporangium ochraceum]